MGRAFEDWVGRDWLFKDGPAVIFWAGLVLVALGPLYAIWRNVGALGILFAEVATAGVRGQERLRPLVANGVQAVAAVALAVWVASFAPASAAGRWVMLAVALALGATLWLLRRRLVYWHSELESGLQDVLAEPVRPGLSVTSAPWLGAHQQEWQLAMADCTVPDLAACAGGTLARLDLRGRFGCTIVGIERQGVMIPLPAPGRTIYPRDRVLLLGATEALAAGKAALTEVRPDADGSDFDEVGMEKLTVSAGSRAAERTLRELAPGQTHGVQIAGLRRGGLRILNPTGEECLRAGDELLLLGTPARLRAFADWLRAEPAEVGGEQGTRDLSAGDFQGGA